MRDAFSCEALSIHFPPADCALLDRKPEELLNHSHHLRWKVDDVGMLATSKPVAQPKAIGCGLQFHISFEMG